MSPHYLSEPAAWREIARRHAEREPLYLGHLRGWADLCAAVEGLRELGRISREMESAMYRRIEGHHALWFEDCAGWIWDSDDWDVRVLAALFLALEADDEAGAP